MPTITEAVRESWVQLPNAEIVTDSETEARVLMLAVDAIRARFLLPPILEKNSTLYAEWQAVHPELTSLADQLAAEAVSQLDASSSVQDSNMKQLGSHIAA